MGENKITITEVAKRAKVSRSLLYHYIKNGLLDPPEHISNKKSGRGVIAVYEEGVVGCILKIKDQLEHTHSLMNVKYSTLLPEHKRKNLIIERLKGLLKMAENGEYKDNNFSNGLKQVGGLMSASTVTVELYTGEHEKIDVQSRKK